MNEGTDVMKEAAAEELSIVDRDVDISATTSVSDTTLIEKTGSTPKIEKVSSLFSVCGTIWDFFVMAAFYTLFAVFCGLMLALLGLFFVVAVGLRVFNVITCRRQEAIALNRTACDFYERKWIEHSDNAFPASTRSEWITLGNVETHHLVLPRNNHDVVKASNTPQEGPAIVLLHGTGSASSLAWSSGADRFSNHYSLYMPDLPGFGRSSFPWSSFEKASLAEIEDVYADWLAEYIDAMQLTKPVVVAHSIGAFFAIKFTKKYPEKLSKIILVDPAGMYPTLGPHGYYFAWLFKFGIPTRQLRAMGRVASALLYSIFDYKKAGAKAYYWLQLNASPSAFGDRVVAKFITFAPSGTSSFWNRPAILDLLTAGVPAAFVYGEVDSLTPPRQGKVTQDLMRCKTADVISPELVNLVRGAWHMPFHINGGTPFVEQTLRAIDVACVPQPTAKLIETLQNLDAEKYQSIWSTKATMGVIESIYSSLRASQ